MARSLPPKIRWPGCCAAGPDFTRPVPPSAARYTAETLPGEGASADEQVQHIALGQQIEGAWWTLFRFQAIDQLVTQAVDHNRTLAASMATLAQAYDAVAKRATGLVLNLLEDNVLCDP
jgi:outer membrane protein TolC